MNNKKSIWPRPVVNNLDDLLENIKFDSSLFEQNFFMFLMNMTPEEIEKFNYVEVSKKLIKLQNTNKYDDKDYKNAINNENEIRIYFYNKIWRFRRLKKEFYGK